MSAKREGWFGWMSEEGFSGEFCYANIAVECHDNYVVPVQLTRLDPDGPKPGETWRWGLQDVEIVTAPWVDHRGDLCVVIRAGVQEIPEYVCRLSPIPQTRTVTVELTEKEIESVRSYKEQLGMVRHYAAMDKLAEALEDE